MIKIINKTFFPQSPHLIEIHVCLNRHFQMYLLYHISFLFSYHLLLSVTIYPCNI